MKMPEFRNTFEQKNLDRVVGNEIHRAEWKLGKSAGRKAGVGGTCPREIFHDHDLQIVGKRPIFGEFAMKEAKITTGGVLSQKIFKKEILVYRQYR